VSADLKDVKALLDELKLATLAGAARVWFASSIAAGMSVTKHL
jgi:hypothetical protein